MRDPGWEKIRIRDKHPGAGSAIKKPTQKNPKNPPKKPTKNVFFLVFLGFFKFLIFYENNTNFSLSN
jgi:hypothetical protein